MSYNKIIFGNEPVIDLTSDTVTPSDVLSGVTFLDKSGTLRTGTATINVSVSNETLTIDGNVKDYTPCDFSTGSAEDIAKAIEWHQEGIIDLRYFWTLGTERVIHIPEITSAYSLETQPEQDITFAIMNYGGKELTNPIGEQTDCTLVLGMKSTLSTAGMLDTNSWARPWGNTSRRTWCNNEFYNAIPSDFRALFKQFKNVAINEEVDDYFSPFAVKELNGTGTGNDASSLVKFDGVTYNISSNYWTRTQEYYGGNPSQMMWYNPTYKRFEAHYSNQVRGIRLFGVL